MKVLITGIAGFIGSNLAYRCVSEGWEITGVDDFSNGHREFLPKSDNVCFYASDFSDDHVLQMIRDEKFDVVFHLAANPRVSYSVERPLETNDTNVTKTLKLIDACKGNVKRFVFASSSAVYGQADSLPTGTFSEKIPNSPYGLQKSIIEDYLTLYYSLYGFESVALRFFNVFGPNQIGGSPYSCAISAWLTAIKRGQPCRSDGDGTQSRDMCHVDNVVEACVLAAKSLEPLKARRFNVATGQAITNAEILKILLNKYSSAHAVEAPWRPGDVMHTLADITTTTRVLNYIPVKNVHDGINDTIKWYDENWDVIKDMVSI